MASHSNWRSNNDETFIYDNESPSMHRFHNLPEDFDNVEEESDYSKPNCDLIFSSLERIRGGGMNEEALFPVRKASKPVITIDELRAKEQEFYKKQANKLKRSDELTPKQVCLRQRNVLLNRFAQEEKVAAEETFPEFAVPVKDKRRKNQSIDMQKVVDKLNEFCREPKAEDYLKYISKNTEKPSKTNHYTYSYVPPKEVLPNCKSMSEFPPLA